MTRTRSETANPGPPSAAVDEAESRLAEWETAGWDLDDARLWLDVWGPAGDTADDEFWMADQASLWRASGFSATEAGQWTDSLDLNVTWAIITRVHGHGPDDDTPDNCSGLSACYRAQWNPDPDYPVLAWAASGLSDERILRCWHAGVSLAEAAALPLTQESDARLNCLAALRPRCPLSRHHP